MENPSYKKVHDQQYPYRNTENVVSANIADWNAMELNSVLIEFRA